MKWLVLIALACNSTKPAPPPAEDRGEKAVAAMKQYNQASQDLETWFPEQLHALEKKLIFDPAGAAKQLGDELLPKLDAYLTTAEQAVTASELYLATNPAVGSDTVANVDKIRRRVVALHAARDALAKAKDDLVAHPGLADLERIGKDLAAAGLALATAQ